MAQSQFGNLISVFRLLIWLNNTDSYEIDHLQSLEVFVLFLHFWATSVWQNAKITRKIPSSAFGPGSETPEMEAIVTWVILTLISYSILVDNLWLWCMVARRPRRLSECYLNNAPVTCRNNLAKSSWCWSQADHILLGLISMATYMYAHQRSSN